ncbi:hypothetical protein DYB32_004583, partial [Aphanomyces invadans]
LPLLLRDAFSDETPVGLERVATIPTRIILGLKPVASTAVLSISRDGAKSPSKYVALPANASYITLENWKARLKLAYTLLQDGSSRLYLAEAAKILRGILALQPHGCDIASLYSYLGSIRLTQHELSDAIACFAQALERTPNAWKVHFNMGIALLRSGRLLEGKAHLHHILAINPSYDVALRALAEVDQKWTGASHETLEKKKASQEFANQLSGVMAVVRHHTETSSPHVDFALVAMEHAAAAFAKDMSQQCAVPVTVPLSRGWHGVVGELLHRLYVMASLKRLLVPEVPSYSRSLRLIANGNRFSKNTAFPRRKRSLRWTGWKR